MKLLNLGKTSMELWRRRMRHLSSRAISILAREKMIDVFNPQTGNINCEPYFVSKSHKLNHHSRNLSHELLNLVLGTLAE